MPGQRPRLLQLLCDDSRNSQRGGALCLSRLPGSVQRIAEVKALYRVGEVAHEIPPPQFAVGENLEPQLFLLRKNARDVTVLEIMQPLRVLAVAPRLQQLRRPQEASHMIRPIFRHDSPPNNSCSHS